jgi:hypothetical protein
MKMVSAQIERSFTGFFATKQQAGAANPGAATESGQNAASAQATTVATTGQPVDSNSHLAVSTANLDSSKWTHPVAPHGPHSAKTQAQTSYGSNQVQLPVQTKSGDVPLG